MAKGAFNTTSLSGQPFADWLDKTDRFHQVLMRESHCFFTIDERAKFTFEQAIEWNYTIIEGDAHQIAHGSALFESVRQAFIDKNPWELPFFLREDLEMYHIRCQRVVCPGIRD